MLSTWPIRRKLRFGIVLLLALIGTLAWSGFQGVYSYRGLVRSLRGRGTELPIAGQLSRKVSDLRILSAKMADRSRMMGDVEATSDPAGDTLLNEEFAKSFEAATTLLGAYRDRVIQAEQEAEGDYGVSDEGPEREKIADIETVFARVARFADDRAELPSGENSLALEAELAELQQHCDDLPGYFHERLRTLVDEVRGDYRALIIISWITTVASACILALLIKLFYSWVFRPLRVLVEGSRRVAGGEFRHRIELDSRDEMAELADAMNDMTARFQAIRDDLDRQVQQRTQQVVRSEQLASVGFLAAGVAHEINNPLASIAMCAESLESRVAEIFATAGELDRSQLDVARNYLRMIQTEAFRCKGITERLLDFSRLGDLKRHETELGELVQSVIDMVGHLGTYHDKKVEFAHRERVVAPVNPQEIKQVVLNLITNALDSLSPGGTVRVELTQSEGRAELRFVDDGCGMTEEVLQNLFEPFFTRRRVGAGAGTGLGLSISYRIVADHGGQIEAHSEGPERGSQLRVTLPLADQHKETRHRSQAA